MKRSLKFISIIIVCQNGILMRRLVLFVDINKITKRILKIHKKQEGFQSIESGKKFSLPVVLYKPNVVTCFQLF